MLLASRMEKLAIKMFRSIKHNKDFEVSLNYESANELPPGVSSTKFAQYSVVGLTEASEKYAGRNLSAPIKANLHFSLSRSGIISLDRADALIEITEWVEAPKKKITLESNNSSGVNTSAESTTDNNKPDDKKEILNIESETINSTSSTTELQDDADVSTEKILKKEPSVYH